jgi:hypothetical protein
MLKSGDLFWCSTAHDAAVFAYCTAGKNRYMRRRVIRRRRQRPAYPADSDQQGFNPGDKIEFAIDSAEIEMVDINVLKADK